MGSALTWNDLADLYYKKTGQHARTKPTESIYDWAVKQPFIVVNKDSSLSVKQPVKNQQT